MRKQIRGGESKNMYGFGWGGFPLFPILWILFWVFVVYMIWGHHHTHHHHHAHDEGDEESESPEDILANRFAKGEIDETEYKKRLEVIKKHTT